MRNQVLLAVLITLMAGQGLRADVPPGPSPWRDGIRADVPPGPSPRRDFIRLDVPPPAPAKVNLRVLRDGNATTARLVLPKDAAGANKRAESQRPSSTLPGRMLALAFTGALVAGGLWLARVPRAKYLVGIMIPLLGLALLGSALHAQTARLQTPRAVLETTKVTITRGEAGQVQLVLPKR